MDRVRCVRIRRLADVGILVRPHPFNSTHWRDADFGDLPNVAIYPHWANPVNESDRQDYFDSLYHSEAVVGVNTTAMIEAAIVGRTVHSVLADEFQDTQGGAALPVSAVRERRIPACRRQSVEHAAQVAETLADAGDRSRGLRPVRASVHPSARHRRPDDADPWPTRWRSWPSKRRRDAGGLYRFRRSLISAVLSETRSASGTWRGSSGESRRRRTTRGSVSSAARARTMPRLTRCATTEVRIAMESD